MRVRKPTSKRSTTRMREGIKKKAAAQNRKNRKQAKKDVTWKSRVNKDPGIPASFPYKDRIIDKIEEKQREAEEKKQMLKEQKRLEREAALQKGEIVADEMEQDDDDEESNPLAALLESAQQDAKEFDGEISEDGDSMDEDDVVEYQIDELESDDETAKETDKSRKAYDKIFKAVVEASDVVLYVLDARDPESTRSKKVEQAVLQNPNKRLILILNKVDMIPTDIMNQWLTFLKQSFPTIPLKAAPGAPNATSFNKNLTQAVTSNALLQSLKTYANKSNLKRSIIVGVIGYPNVGKSSLINALISRHGGPSKACPVGNIAGVTTSLREVKVDNKLKILDSPGIVFPDEKKSKIAQESKLALLSAIPPKQITDPMSAVTLLLKKLAKDSKMAEGVKTYYQMPAIPSNDLNEFTKQFLIHVARKRGRLARGGIPNLEAAATTVLTDWRDGRIVGWTVPKFGKDIDQQKANDASSSSTPSVPLEQTKIVSEWAKEFDLDGLLSGAFNDADE